VRALTAGAFAALAGACLAGCLGLLGDSRRDDLSTWQAQPLPPDAGLAAKAIGDNGACRMDDPSDAVFEPVPVILVQDRRTFDSAAFLVQSPAHFGSCTVTRASGGSGGGYGPPLLPMAGPITIDDRGSGTLGDASAQELGGRIAVQAARVVVQLSDGSNVTASVANGFWLSWWPGTAIATRVVAIDGSGAEIANLEATGP
jgi:hypothetical protein